MSIVRLPLELALLAIGVPGVVGAIELQRSTLNAWDDYIQSADKRIQARLDGRRPFLWIDEEAGRRDRLRRGEVIVAPVVGHGTQPVPNGLIHDWIGAVFIPNATLERLFAVVHDYDRYKDVYRPVVANSKVLACSDADQRFSMIWQHKILFVNAAMDAEYQAHDSVDGRRGYNIASTIRVREIQSFGQSDEHLMPPDEGNGFMWRVHSIARYEERDGGVYLELEAIALTRDIPASLRWLVDPVVHHLSINSLTTTLRQTRDAVTSLEARPERIASCAERNRNVGISNSNPEERKGTISFVSEVAGCGAQSSMCRPGNRP
jgi:hypothetical protein